MVTQRVISTCELSVREAAGALLSLALLIGEECGCAAPMAAWYHLARELSQPSSLTQTEVIQELGCCEGMLLITSGMKRSYNIRNAVSDAESLSDKTEQSQGRKKAEFCRPYNYH